jgi:hypothetical protein
VSRGRAAALPPAAFVRASSLDASGLVVTVEGESGGIVGRYDFGGLDGALALRRGFAAVFDRKAGPGGTWRSGETVAAYRLAVKSFLTFLSGLEKPPQAAGQITAGMWNQWRLQRGTGVSATRSVLAMRQILPLLPGMQPGTLAAVLRRVPSRPPPSAVAYNRAELDRITSAATAAFQSALARIRSSTAHLRRWREGGCTPGGRDDLIGEALDALMRTGYAPHYRYEQSGRVARVVRWRHAQALGGRADALTSGRLFLSQQEVRALAVLLVASQGWNAGVLHVMRVPDYDPAEASDELTIFPMELVKPRRPVSHRYSTDNLADVGEGSAGRLMRHAIEATAPAREALALRGMPTDRLLVSRRTHRGEDPTAGLLLGLPRMSCETGVRPDWLTRAAGDAATPRLSLRRIRRTVLVLMRREPAQNSAATHENVYVLPDPVIAVAAAATISEGLSGAVTHAQATLAIRVAFGAGGDALTTLADDPATAHAIARGELDTATAACTDFHHSPHDPPGLPCTASFLLCLACPNAVATRRHLPRLVHLHRALQELRATLTPAVWDLDWREHFHRVDALLVQHTTQAERDAALWELTGSDRELIDQLLNRGFDS